MEQDSTKSKNHYRIPGKLWKLLKKHLPKVSKVRGPGRPRGNNRDAIDGIWYVLWTGCQWESIRKEWFHASSSVLHERFQTWQRRGLFEKLFKTIVQYYARECGIHWIWQSIDSMMSAAPLGGAQTGKNPTDRGKSGSKIHLLVDQLGAPLALWITGANEHDKWSADNLIVHIVAKRPFSEQHFCADKGYDFEDVHEVVSLNDYIDHIKYKQKRNEPKDECPIPGEKSFPARR
jgi:putative transposase